MYFVFYIIFYDVLFKFKIYLIAFYQIKVLNHVIIIIFIIEWKLTFM